jgi:hypothetical protein
MLLHIFTIPSIGQELHFEEEGDYARQQAALDRVMAMPYDVAFILVGHNPKDLIIGAKVGPRLLTMGVRQAQLRPIFDSEELLGVSKPFDTGLMYVGFYTSGGNSAVLTTIGLPFKSHPNSVPQSQSVRWNLDRK